MPDLAREDESWPLPCIDHGIVDCEDCGQWTRAADAREDQYAADVERIRSEAERETVQRITAWLRAQADIAAYPNDGHLRMAAAGIEGEFGDKEPDHESK